MNAAKYPGISLRSSVHAQRIHEERSLPRQRVSLPEQRVRSFDRDHGAICPDGLTEPQDD